MYRSKILLLRSFTENDAPFLIEMKMDFEGLKAAGGRPFPSNQQSEKEWISKMYPNGLLSNIYFVIEECDSNQFVGYCSATDINYLNRNAHVGFFFHKNARGKGYFKKAQVLFYSYLFNEVNLKKLYSHALAYNTLAITTDKKIGFKEDGIMKEHIYQGGIYHDIVLLSLTKEDFFEINGSYNYEV